MIILHEREEIKYMIILTTFLFIVLSYLFGGLNGALLLCKLKGWEDPRTNGSKNPGATNMLRVHNAQAASAVFIFDLLKGTIPVYLSYLYGSSPVAIGLIGMSVCLGHIFPIYFQFKGGKGVATALGVLLPLGMNLSGALVLTWLVTIAVSGYASLAAIITAISAPLFVYLIKPEYTIPVIMLSSLIVFCHMSNIKRLINKKEKKIVSWKK